MSRPRPPRLPRRSPFRRGPAPATDPASGVSSRGWWRGRPHSHRQLALVVAGCALYLAIFVVAVVGLLDSDVRWLFDYGGGAGDTVRSVLMWPLTLAVVAGLFLLWRYHRVWGPYRAAAQRAPRDLVATAGSVSGEVVGRDELCEALIRDLDVVGCASRTHVVVGRMGSGKTALLVLMTQRLAELHAVPVPVRLRDARDRLDFCELGFERFLEEVSASVASRVEAEKVWRRLLQERRVVILADGLEEALLGEDRASERDNLIRRAIRTANQQDLPLVIASRPHDPLRGMEATVSELEPLSEEAALRYVSSGGGWSANKGTVDWIVQTADFPEAPLYLQLARQLHGAELLEHSSAQQAGELPDVRGLDRAGLRLHLFDTWAESLVNGHLYPWVSLGAAERGATLDYLSALALVGLGCNSVEVAFTDLLGTPDGGAPPHPEVVEELARRMALYRRSAYCDGYMAATWGQQLGIVEAYGDRVRFRHSLMQSYLGSRLLPTVLTEDGDGAGFLAAALREPGREMLSALVLYSRSRAGRCTHTGTGDAESWCPVRLSRDLLLAAVDDSAHGPPPAARNRRPTFKDAEARALALPRAGAEVLDLYAAAIEVDAAAREVALDRMAGNLADLWGHLRDRDPEALDEAKISLVRTLGAAVRELARRNDLGRDQGRRLAAPSCGIRTLERVYRALFRMAVEEPSYEVRLALALQIGIGGDAAFAALRKRLADPTSPPANDTAGSYGTDGEADAERVWRERTLCAWLLPLLAGSATGRDGGESPLGCLHHWLTAVGEERPPDTAPLSLPVEMALAQGFKLAANRRHRHPCARGPRTALADHAWEMMRRTRFWYSRLTLLHARTLWELPDDVSRPSTSAAGDPDELVRQWLTSPGGEPERHPFLLAGARLAAEALRTRRPERYLWTDESLVVAQIGSRDTAQGEPRKHNQWIPYSIGWSALVPAAQQLIADVLLLLNLAEQSGHVADRVQHLGRTDRPRSPYLPPCFTEDRSPLRPELTGADDARAAGGSASCGCPFELCPYPPRTRTSVRADFSEMFCRRQMSLLRPTGRFRRKRQAPWQRDIDAERLAGFWERMGDRSRQGSADDPPPGRR
ncbi:NACHT domain-containing protein [Streptomyces sp. B6B3]|uniref:NACHT domain-containing protein n=1 Tax=Streptomyces sp. B6B3 TaxID=3153570 RepID=UPI00325E1655